MADMDIPRTGDLLFLGLAGLMLIIVALLMRRARRLSRTRRGPPGPQDLNPPLDGGNGGDSH
jgi:hypothetical protein